jgi:predicted DNA-binding transcriptional regulator YafY
MCTESLEAIVKTSIWIDYISGDGTRTWHNVVPVSAYPPMQFTKTKEFPEEQWLLSAYDFKSGKVRSFAMANIKTWRTAKEHNFNTQTAI